MLTASQCEVVAFTFNGEYLCRDCAKTATSPSAVMAAEEGFASGFDLSPLIRYQVDEIDGERVYEAAEERLRDWAEDHPQLTWLLGVNDSYAPNPLYPHDRVDAGKNRWRLIDRLAEKFEDTYAERCGDCGERLT